MLIESPLLASDYCLPMNLNTLLAIGSSAYFNKIVDIGVIPSWRSIRNPWMRAGHADTPARMV